MLDKLFHMCIMAPRTTAAARQGTARQFSPSSLSQEESRNNELGERHHKISRGEKRG